MYQVLYIATVDVSLDSWKKDTHKIFFLQKFYLIYIFKKNEQEISKLTDRKEEARRRIFLLQQFASTKQVVLKGHVPVRTASPVWGAGRQRKGAAVISCPIVESLGGEIHPLVSFISVKTVISPSIVTSENVI